MALYAIDYGCGFGITPAEALPVLADVGFDGFFTGWSDSTDVKAIAACAKECGLIYQSIHAPFTKMHKMWEPGEEGEAAADELIRCLHACAENGVPIMIVHPIIGMDRHNPCDLGVERFGRVVAEAEKCGVKTAFENVEGIEYFLKLRDSLGSSDAVGFCWDTGHEMCYNYSIDVPSLFKGKLICTHLNDNMGHTDQLTTINWKDDSHLMPFDGKADWQNIAARLDRENYTGIMTFELTRNNKPERHTHDIYADLDYRGFMALAYEKALKLGAMRKI